MAFKIECIVTCVNYGDFLAESLPSNRALFDKTVVVTAPEDKHTKQVCDYWNVQCIRTDVFESRWDKFNKGKGINIGLNALDKDAWILHMDADIVLPPTTRTLLEAAKLDTTCIYGIDRHIVIGSEPWTDFLTRPKLQQEGWSDYADCGKFVHIHDKFPIGTRVAHPSGYIPIGFFQLWHADSKVFSYPEQHTDAGRGDMLHALKWPRAKRHMIPEIIGYHLESEQSVMGINWQKRTTRPFRDRKD